MYNIILINIAINVVTYLPAYKNECFMLRVSAFTVNKPVRWYIVSEHI